MSFARLQRRIDELANPSVVGLDPALEIIPPFITENAISLFGETLEAAAHAVLCFNEKIIDAICDIVPAVKPQAAYYEKYGVPGMEALRKTAQYAAKRGMYVIADAKRNDIGSTAEAYSNGLLGTVIIGSTHISPFTFDAVTVNGYLGRDGILPFCNDAEKYDKALFVLVKTSNPSSGELQDRLTDGKKVYNVMGGLIESLANGKYDENGYSRIGAVVGATYPTELSELRNALRHTYFLVPGYGAQGGGAIDVKAAFDLQKRGAVINSSRAVIGAWKKTENDGRGFAEAARDAALNMRQDLRMVLGI